MERKARRLLREDGAGETPQALSAEEAPRTARGKRSAWSGNQQPSLTEPKEKTAPNRNCQLTCNGVKLFPLI
ncbi:hypothetical protein [Neobacillus drentensis]|uniref:hypothetical protein n=1 Tax=Neobacillus drentensis TaxID=220684 RepID=UPI0030028613